MEQGRQWEDDVDAVEPHFLSFGVIGYLRTIESDVENMKIQSRSTIHINERHVSNLFLEYYLLRRVELRFLFRLFLQWNL